MRRVIVNADDCNLTAGVTRGILECYEKGIVTSTSWMITQPSDSGLVSEVGNCGIGIGLHLNVTFGKSISNKKDVSSLLDDADNFRKKGSYADKWPKLEHLIKEYGSQIELFEKTFGRLPTHLDTHHQMHDDPLFMHGLAHVAGQYKLPVRRSALMNAPGFKHPELRTTQTLFGNLSAHEFWTTEKLEKTLGRLLPGTAEIMCHPGIWTAELESVTSMTIVREKEHALFSSPHLRKILENLNIEHINFSNL